MGIERTIPAVKEKDFLATRLKRKEHRTPLA
jgi:hypothetical protein